MATAGARRYARAIFEVAQEEGAIEDWGSRLRGVRELFANPDLHRLLADPTVPSERRQQAVEVVAGEQLGPEGVNLAKLLVEGDRIGDVDGIADEYERLADEAAGRVRAIATTAVELPRGEFEALVRDLSARLGKDVKLEVNIDPGIVGGLVLQIGDRVVDASLATRLQQLRRWLATA